MRSSVIVGPDPTPRDLTGLVLVAHIRRERIPPPGEPHAWWITHRDAVVDTGYCNVDGDWQHHADELLAKQGYERVGAWELLDGTLTARVRALS